MADPRKARDDAAETGKSGPFNNFIDVDGSLLEGGGQVLRIAIALSAIKKVPVRIFNIRAGRSKPGLGEQHLKGVYRRGCCKTSIVHWSGGGRKVHCAAARAYAQCTFLPPPDQCTKYFFAISDQCTIDVLQQPRRYIQYSGLLLVTDMCGGQLKGAEIGSQEILFTPGPIQSGHFEARVKTAGSVALLMQVCVPVALFAPGQCNISFWGGTDADMAPTIDYMTLVTTPLFKKFGAHFDINLIKRGFFPRGGGEVRLQVNHLQTGLKPVTLVEPGEVSSIQGVAVAGGSCPLRVAHEMKKGAETVLLEHFGKLAQPYVKVQQGPADCPGSSITIMAHTSTGCILGASAIGNRKKQPYDIGVQAANDLVAANPGQLCLDLHAQDQVILPMALSSGTSKVFTGPLTLHTRTAIAVVQMFCKAKFQIEEKYSTNTIIVCTGDPP